MAKHTTVVNVHGSHGIPPDVSIDERLAMIDNKIDYAIERIDAMLATLVQLEHSLVGDDA